MERIYLLGLDVGSSSVKASLVDAETGETISSAFRPKKEAPISAPMPGFAEQEPEDWWSYAREAISDVLRESGADGDEIKAVGISYQMHGLVCLDKNLHPLRPAIIWCDSRAVEYGERALEGIGSELCLGHILNSPGNFTASKLAWVKECQPDIYDKIHKIMLPGDYIALRLTGEAFTTIGGLSEAMLWDFSRDNLFEPLLDFWGIGRELLCPLVPTFGIQGRITSEASRETGLAEGIPVAYRAGDQPNNALSLNVLEPGEIAATGGTSGVVYGILSDIGHDPKSRINIFAHVNHEPNRRRLGALLCINGCGILNNWVKNVLTNYASGYDSFNVLASEAPIGSEGLSILPFGNGAERVLESKPSCCTLSGIDFNRHCLSHIARATQEGIAFSFCYGMEIMRDMGMRIENIHAGKANLFQSEIFRKTLSTTSGASIDLYDTDGAKGAALGAGIGAGIYAGKEEAFSSLRKVITTEPERDRQVEYSDAYDRWKCLLNKMID